MPCPPSAGGNEERRRRRRAKEKSADFSDGLEKRHVCHSNGRLASFRATPQVNCSICAGRRAERAAESAHGANGRGGRGAGDTLDRVLFRGCGEARAAAAEGGEDSGGAARHLSPNRSPSRLQSKRSLGEFQAPRKQKARQSNVARG